MLNHSTHALEALRQLDLTHLPAADAQALHEVMGLLHKAVKFELPTNGTLFGEDFEKGYDILEPDLLRLPFETVALEYRYEYFDGGRAGERNVPVVKRIALCLDIQAHQNLSFLRRLMVQAPHLVEAGGVLVYPILCYGDVWTPIAWGVALPRIESDGTNLTTYRYGKGLTKTARIGLLPVPVLHSVVTKMMVALGPEQTIKDAFHDCGEEVTSLVGLLAALSCRNVYLKDTPSPDKLNAKRAKAGRPEFYGFKTLEVDTHKPTREGAGHSETPSGRLSPKEHIRRGHIRRLQNGSRIWVQAAVVGAGSKGVIHKTYKIK